MRILHLQYDHPQNPWLGGGGAKYVHEIYRRLRQRHAVTVMTGSWPGAPRQQVIDGVRYVHARPGLGRIQSQLCYGIRAALRAMRKDYDLLVDSVSPFCPTFAGTLSRGPTVADIGLDLYGSARRFRAIRPIVTALLNQNLRGHRNFIAVAPGLERLLREKLGTGIDVRVIPLGVDRELFDLESEEAPYLLFLGRTDIEHKGLDCLLDAYALFRARRPEIGLVIAGSGPEEQKLRRMAEERGVAQTITWAGWVTGPARSDLLRRCLVLCLPSRREGWPIVANEAGACGKPVIGFNATGVCDAVRNGETGLLVPYEDTRALAEAMGRIADDAGLRHTLGSNARKWAEQFTWERTAESYGRYYEEVIARACKH